MKKYPSQKAFRQWLQQYSAWVRNGRPLPYPLPDKPPGFDLWLQGENPLKLRLNPSARHDVEVMKRDYAERERSMTAVREALERYSTERRYEQAEEIYRRRREEMYQEERQRALRNMPISGSYGSISWEEMDHRTLERRRPVVRFQGMDGSPMARDTLTQEQRNEMFERMASINPQYYAAPVEEIMFTSPPNFTREHAMEYEPVRYVIDESHGYPMMTPIPQHLQPYLTSYTTIPNDH